MVTVEIVWNRLGCKLYYVTVQDDDNKNIRNALIKLAKGNIIMAGDSFIINAVTEKSPSQSNEMVHFKEAFVINPPRANPEYHVVDEDGELFIFESISAANKKFNGAFDIHTDYEQN